MLVDFGQAPEALCCSFPPVRWMVSLMDLTVHGLTDHTAQRMWTGSGLPQPVFSGV